jgi:hypothetical protein
VALVGTGTGVFHVTIDGTTVATFNVTDTGGWQNFVTQTKTGIAISGGQHIMRVAMDAENAGAAVANMNWFQFTAAAGGQTYNAAADTFGRDGSFVDTNCNTSTSCGSTTANEIEVKNTAGFARETLLRFSGVTGTTATAATLHLCSVNNADFEVPGTARTIVVEGIANDSWSETALTWNNRPLDAGQNAVSLSLSTAGACLDFIVQPFVNAQLAGSDGTISFRVRDTSGRRTPFNSRAAASGVPTLTVTN